MNLRQMAKKLSQKLVKQDKANSKELKAQTDDVKSRFSQWWKAFSKGKDQYTAADDNKPADADAKKAVDDEAKRNGLKPMAARTNADVVDYAAATFAAGFGKKMIDKIGGKLREVFTSPKQKKAADKIINESLDGAKWSDRIWSNTAELRAELFKDMRKSLLTHTDPRQFSDQITKEFDVQHYQADRILRTEGARVHTRKQLADFKQQKHEYVEVVAQDGACEDCAKLDGHVFEIGHEPGDMPPFHPNCRCVLMPATKDEMSEQNIETRDVTSSPVSSDQMKYINKISVDDLKNAVAKIEAAAKSMDDSESSDYHDPYHKAMYQLAKNNGMDALPHLISGAAFDKIPEKNVMYRQTSRASQLKTGALEYSSVKQSLNGRGIYFVPDKDDASRYERSDTELIRVGLAKDAVIVDQIKLAEKARQLINESGLHIKPSLYAGRVFYDILAMESGIDGWYAPNDTYITIVNRGKLVISK